jgi:membrane protease YdiL (CAAX protease family)
MTATSVDQAPGSGAGLTRFSIVRILLATLAVCIPAALTLVLTHQIHDEAMRAAWPQLLAAGLCAAGYVLYVRRVEKRAVSELAGPCAWRELAAGLGLGAGLFLAIAGALAVLASFRVTGHDNWTVMIAPFALMVMVAVIEEILFRGVIFRITERSLGSWAACLVSSLLFVVAHLSNEGMTLLAVSVTFAAGVLLAAAFMVTRRLWLAIGFHFAWNFTSDAVFSLPTSGQPAKGLLHAQLVGPEWLTGGGYGVEASAVTLLVLAVAAGWLLWSAIRRGHVIGFSARRT